MSTFSFFSITALPPDEEAWSFGEDDEAVEGDPNSTSIAFETEELVNVLVFFVELCSMVEVPSVDIVFDLSP